MTALLAVLAQLLIFVGATGIGTVVERCLARACGVVRGAGASGQDASSGWEPGQGDLADSGDEVLAGRTRLFSLAFRAVLGLVCYLWIVFCLKSFHLHWIIASLAPALVGSFLVEDLIAEIRQIRFQLSIGFTIWITAIILLGSTIIDTSDGIGTPWVNNYGDLPWHLGMAASFTWGDNFPPEYQIFPGRNLAYPFFTSLLNASTLWIDGSFHSLTLTAMIIWIFAWCMIWIALDGTRRPLLPWALLLGGGTYPFVVHILSGRTIFGPQVEFSHTVLGSWPWVPFFTTMWIPQRGTWLGLTVAVMAVARFHAFLQRVDSAPVSSESERMARFELLATAVLLGISPLVHGHFTFTIAIYISLVLALRVVARVRRAFDLDEHQAPESSNEAGMTVSSSRAVEAMRPDVLQLLLFCTVAWALCGLVFSVWIADRASALKLTWGWMPWWQQGGVKAPALLGSAAMWLSNAPVWIALLLLLLLLRKSRIRTIALAITFCFFSIVQLTTWDWDQLKAFSALYMISLSMLGELSVNRWLRTSLLVLLIVPAAVEVGRVGIYYQRYTVFSKEDVEVAEKIRQSTRPKAIIAGKPAHNSPVPLAGRYLYMGYEGTLASHGLKYGARKRVNADLGLIAGCEKEPPLADDITEQKRSRSCPEHLLWTQREKTMWGKPIPGASFTPRLPGLLYDVTPKDD